MLKDLNTRLMARVVVNSSGCWLWTGYCIPQGYGRLSVNNKPTLAHRAMYKLHKGDIPSDLQVLHKCDVRNCLNPDHLFLGTVQDNMADKVAKGRQVRGEAHYKWTGKWNKEKYEKKYYLENKEKMNANGKSYYLAHREKILAQKREYYQSKKTLIERKIINV